MPLGASAALSSGILKTIRKPSQRHYLLAVAYLVVVAAAVISQVSPEHALEVAPLGILVAGGVAGGLMIAGARTHAGREKVAWTVIGAGFLLAAFGVLLVALIDTFVGPVPAFGPQDLIFMAAYGGVLTGFFLMPQLGPVFRSAVRVMLDGVIGAVSMAILVSLLFLDGLREHLLDANAWESFAGVSYPLIDSAMVVVAMIVTIRRSAWRFDPRVVLFGLGMCLQALGDLGLLSTGLGQDFQVANPNYLLYLGAMACYLTAAALIRHRPAPREYADRRQPLWAMVAPYGAGLVVIGLIVNRLRHAFIGDDTIWLVTAGLLLLLLVVTRQAVALREYRSLVDQQRRALVGSVSHELRTPLTAMVGFLDLMKDPEMDQAERLELTDVVHQQATYMSRIVSDLLLLARDSNRLILVESEVPFRRLVADTVRSARVSAEALQTEVEAELVARVDRDRIRQVLDNLIINAFRYGRGQVLLSAVAVGPDLVIEVHDNGEGVPRKYELAIWQQFERGHNRLNATVPGSGIGLAVVEFVVRRHGGTATYERSKRLGGSCFRVVLPGRVIDASKQENAPETTKVAKLPSGLSV